MYINLTKKNNINKIDNFINLYNLKEVLSNKRTTIWRNELIKISIDRKVIRICLDDDNIQFVPQVKQFFDLGVKNGTFQ